MGRSFCDLEVDVNGEAIFMVDKNIITSYSGRLRKLFGKYMRNTGNLKVIFNDLPGGAESFELLSRFCYNHGSIDISSSNISRLHCVAHFMEMKSSVCGADNLLELTEKSLQEISYWTWCELLDALKQCQYLFPVENSFTIVEKCLNSFAERLALGSVASSRPSTSPDSSSFRFSCDTKSTESLQTSSPGARWWFEDLLFLNCTSLEILVKSMVSRGLDHAIISRFLFYYHKSKFYNATSEEKYKIVETVVELLYMLDQSSVSCKSLFVILRLSLRSNMSKSCKNKLENMIGSQMDRATVDDLLVPSGYRINNSYDVNLVLRLVKAFMQKRVLESPRRLRRVAWLMDLYMAEVAPDPCLKPSKFLALAIALPDSARECYDELYHAIDMYLQVHEEGISEEEKMKLCCAVNYKKLSPDVSTHISQKKKKNNFPPKSSVERLISQQLKLQNL